MGRIVAHLWVARIREVPRSPGLPTAETEAARSNRAGAWLNQAVFEGSELRTPDALVLRTLPPLPEELPQNRAQREREAKAYWDSLTPQQEAWVLRKMRFAAFGDVGRRAGGTVR
jgi:hypothetical protein